MSQGRGPRKWDPGQPVRHFCHNRAGPFHHRPHPALYSACLLSVENFSQRISLIREMKTCRNKENSQRTLNNNNAVVKHHQEHLVPSQELEIIFWAISCESECHSFIYNFLRPLGLYSPWNSRGQNAGVGSLFLLQWSSQPRDQTRSPALQADSLSAEPPGKPKNTRVDSLCLLQWIFPT